MDTSLPYNIMIRWCLLLTLPALIVAQNARPITYNVVEETAEETVLGTLISDTNMDETIGFDEASRLQFRIVSPDSDEHYITVGENNGIVRIKKRIDREEICPLQDDCLLHYDVVVSPVEFFMIIKITLNITDLNDHAPTFPSPDLILQISESTVPGTLFAVPSAEDLDGGDFGIQQHELVSDTRVFEMKVRAIAKGRFDIRIQLIDQLDRENIDKYELKIVVRDGGIPPREGTLNVHILVEDSNDNAPEFDPASYEATVVENLPTDTTIARVRAHDRDIGLNGQIRYSFSSQTRQDYGAMFEIKSDTGDVKVKGALDYEQRSLYVLTVDAHDQGAGALSSQTSVVVHVEDYNDEYPQISINTLHTSGAVVAENAAPGTFVAHLSVTDNDQGDGGTFICTIATDDFDIRKIAVDQYNIYSREVFDREKQDVYEFPIFCTDNGYPALTTHDSIEVKIGDENDHAPRFGPESIDMRVMENRPPGAFIVTMNATDVDEGRNARLVYRLSGDITHVLSIDHRTGVITTKQLLDHEKTQELNFVVYAEDRGDPIMTSSSTVHVTIEDEDDEWPLFEQNSYTFTVKENQNPGEIVGTVIAHDADSIPYNEFRYELNPQPRHADLFHLHPESGVLTTTATLDREKASSYSLIATASPRSNPSQTSECHILIEVQDVNDNSPVFTFPQLGSNDTVQLDSHAPVGQTVAILRAYDRDANDNPDLMFKIIEGNDDDIFNVNSGHILLYKDVSRLTNKRYKLTVEVKDKGERSDRATLYIFIVNASTEAVIVKEKEPVGPLLQSQILTIILAVTAGALLVLIIIAMAIIIFCRKHKRSAAQRHQDEKECQKMLQHNGSLDPSPVSKEYPSNGVTVIDMRNEKNSKLPLDINGEEQIPLTVDLLSNHPIVKQNGTTQQNGYMNKFSTFSPQHNGSKHMNGKHINGKHINGKHINGYNKQYSHTLAPSRDYSNLSRDYANGGQFHKGGKPQTRSSTASGEYVPYDLVDTDV